MLLIRVVLVCFAADGYAAREGHDGQSAAEFRDPSGSGHEIPGLSFQLFVDRWTEGTASESPDKAEANVLLQTVTDSFPISINIGIPILGSMKR